MVTATSSYSGNSGSAEVQDDSLAWTVQVTNGSGGAHIRAVPRGFRNGSEMRGDDIWVAKVIDPKFDDFWHEVDSNLAGR